MKNPGFRYFFRVTLAWAGLFPAALPAADIDAVLAEARKDLQTEQAELAKTYAEIRDKRLAIVSRQEEKRRQLDSLQGQQHDFLDRKREVEAEIAGLQQEIGNLKQLKAYTASMLSEYRQTFETTLAAGDAVRLQPKFAEIDSALRAMETEGPASPMTHLLGISADYASETVGGVLYDGVALDRSGSERQGRVARFGPVTYFDGGAEGLRGLAVAQIGSVLPTVFADLGPESDAAITGLFAQGQGEIPFDVTQGSAIRLAETRDTWREHLEKGGITIIPLLLLAAVCTVMAFVKLGALAFLAGPRARIRVARIVTALRQGDGELAQSLARKLRRPLGPVIRTGIEYRDVTKEHLEEILYEQIISQVPGLERFLTPLSVCASAAPLLGLLGTVTGMIHTFRLITVFGTGDAKLLSSGISEALITTEVGLMIAIPALLVHAFLARRVRRAIALTHEMALSFVNGIKLKEGESA